MNVITYATLKNLKRINKEKSVKPTVMNPLFNGEIITPPTPQNTPDIPPIQPTIEEKEIIDCKISEIMTTILTYAKKWDENLEMTDLIVANETEWKILKRHREVMKKSIDDYIDRLMKKMSVESDNLFKSPVPIPPKIIKKSFFGKKSK